MVGNAKAIPKRYMTSMPLYPEIPAKSIGTFLKATVICFIANANLFAIIKVFARTFLKSFRNDIDLRSHTEAKDYMAGSLVIRDEVDAAAIDDGPFLATILSDIW